MNSKPAPNEDEIIRQVQLLAGRAFLSCLNLEEHLKQLLHLMAQLSVGGLTPADAVGILNRDRKLTSGQALADIRRNIDSEVNWTQAIEGAVDARNTLLHRLPFTQWAVDDAAALARLDGEVKALTRQISAGVVTIRLTMKALGEVLLSQHPQLRTSEWDRILAEYPQVRVTGLPAPPP